MLPWPSAGVLRAARLSDTLLEDEDALAGFAFRPDLAAMAADDADHGGQPDASAGKLPIGVQALEGSDRFSR